jgi:hypothetical protein
MIPVITLMVLALVLTAGAASAKRPARSIAQLIAVPLCEGEPVSRSAPSRARACQELSWY